MKQYLLKHEVDLKTLNIAEVTPDVKRTQLSGDWTGHV
jgi:hypothetical protein